MPGCHASGLLHSCTALQPAKSGRKIVSQALQGDGRGGGRASRPPRQPRDVRGGRGVANRRRKRHRPSLHRRTRCLRVPAFFVPCDRVAPMKRNALWR